MNMEATLSKRLIENKGQFANDDPEWVQFIKDHYTYLVTNSNTLNINVNDMLLLKHRPEELLVDNGYPREIWWIVMFMNQIASHSTFVGVTTLLVPKLEELVMLKEQYGIQSQAVNTTSKLFE